jgi:uncharacterized Tic20 family protein
MVESLYKPKAKMPDEVEEGMILFHLLTLLSLLLPSFPFLLSPVFLFHPFQL